MLGVIAIGFAALWALSLLTSVTLASGLHTLLFVTASLLVVQLFHQPNAGPSLPPPPHAGRP